MKTESVLTLFQQNETELILGEIKRLD